MSNVNYPSFQRLLQASLPPEWDARMVSFASLKKVPRHSAFGTETLPASAKPLTSAGGSDERLD